MYPEAKKVDHVDDYHGTKVADPYRWLENPDSEETRAWIAAQNKLTFAFLEEIPARARIKERLTKLWDFERYGVPFKEGGRYFYEKNDGLQNQNVLYTVTSLGGEPKVLLDPNQLSADGTVALAGYAVSEDGKLMAYGLAASGSDWTEWRVREVETGRDLPDTIKWVKFSGASWTKDGRGFFYSRYAEPHEKTKLEDANYFQKLYYHRLGTPQSEDVLVYERPDQKEWGFSGGVTEDGRYLIISVWQGTDPKNRLYYKDLTVKDAPVVKLIDNLEAAYNFIGNDGPVFWFRTDWEASRGRIIAIDTRKPERANWKVVVPQAAETLEGVSLVHDLLIASFLPERRLHPGQALPLGRRLRPRSRLPRHRHRHGLHRQAQRRGDLLLLHQLHYAAHGLPLRPGDRQERGLPPAGGGLPARRLRDQTGLLPEQGRDARADVHHPPPGPEA
jgi:prolyl oligopeptidase